MPLTTSSEIRQAFLDYFLEKQGHTHVPSSPVVPHDDPTLLFTNAGMNQYKPVFLEQVPPGSPLQGLKRAANSQKCIRAGGKHNDLEDVGKDTYHHTFFEMLGNWSFGDYFKAESIEWGFEFLTSVCGIDPQRLYATYFGGDADAGLEPDEEARELWLKYLPAERVLPFGMKDNFWEMGETGPCGPCSEIHFDRIGGRDASSLVNMDDPDVIEVWNLVFIQFNRENADTLKPLPAKHVDTGMGLERLASVLLEKPSNYDTDLFTPIFERISAITGARGYSGKLGAEDTDRVDMAYRVIADHVRTLTVAITDGATPSNEGRGYVLRRVLRRAVRFGRQMLNAETGFLSGLVPTVVEMLGGAFPELVQHRDRVVEIVREEEESFGRTLDKGIRQFDDIARGGGRVSGEDAFKLYDTFGFPLDLTQIMAEERGLDVDVPGFERAMEAQRERSRAGSKFGGEGESLKLEPDALARLAYLDIPPTDDGAKYDPRLVRAQVRAIWAGARFGFEESVGVNDHERVGVVLDKTCFYAEAGGQVADTGELRLDEGEGRFEVEDVQAFGQYVLHIGRVADGELRVGAMCECDIDTQARTRTAANHTTTHLLNLALRAELGDHTDQRGSLVDPDKLRFDFAHNKPVEPAELEAIESTVRDRIERGLEVRSEVAPLEAAKKIGPVRAVFGEKYPDPVRVVAIGADVGELVASPDDDRWTGLSVEFCGGTHLSRTDEAKAFALVSETGIAKGIRRIEGLTGVPALAAISAADNAEQRLGEIASLPDSELGAAISAWQRELEALTLPTVRRSNLQEKLGELHGRVKAAQKAAAGAIRERAIGEAKSIAEDAKAGGRAFVSAVIDAGEDRAAIQAACKSIVDATNLPTLLLSASDDKVAIIAMCPADAVGAGLKAGDWIREVAPVVGGKGGGKPDQAQGGGTDPAKAGEAIESAAAFAERSLAR